ncbi:MAG: hypothetical protein ACAI25_17610, partial [Planctomycetota bacterium]
MSAPLLVARSESHASVGCLVQLGFATAWLLAFLAYALMREGSLPWQPDIPGWAYGIAAFALVGLLSALMRWHQRHEGLKVDFHETTILFGELGGKYGVEVPWSDVVGFKDDHLESVEIVRRPGAPQIKLKQLLVPTPTEELRTAVLALLDERGV